MTHLSHDELIDAVEGTLGPDRQAHVDGCGVCAQEAARLRAIVREMQDVAIPEPSPLFWNHLSVRVHDAIAAEGSPRAHRSPAWLQWSVLAPVAALALLILALASALPRQPLESPAVAVTAQEPVTDLASVGEPGWEVVSELVGSVDLQAAQDAGIVRLGDAERAALQMSAAEQQELLRLLHEEMDKAGG